MSLRARSSFMSWTVIAGMSGMSALLAASSALATGATAPNDRAGATGDPPERAAALDLLDLETKDIDFLGFTIDEKISAWRVTYKQPRDVNGTKVVDEYTVFCLVDADTRNIVLTFRATPVRRKWLSGPKHKFRAAQIEAANPTWLTAEPTTRWKKFLKHVKLHKELVAMDDSAVRLYTDDDTDLELHANKDNISAIAPVGEPLGYAPIARRMDSTLMNLGHYRVEGLPGIVHTSTVEVFRSRTAKHLAVICRFFHKDDKAFGDSMATVAATGQERFATNTIGIEQMLDVETQLGGEIFMRQFPELKNMYEFYIGKTW